MASVDPKKIFIQINENNPGSLKKYLNLLFSQEKLALAQQQKIPMFEASIYPPNINDTLEAKDIKLQDACILNSCPVIYAAFLPKLNREVLILLLAYGFFPKMKDIQNSFGNEIIVDYQIKKGEILKSTLTPLLLGNSTWNSFILFSRGGYVLDWFFPDLAWDVEIYRNASVTGFTEKGEKFAKKLETLLSQSRVSEEEFSKLFEFQDMHTRGELARKGLDKVYQIANSLINSYLQLCLKQIIEALIKKSEVTSSSNQLYLNKMSEHITTALSDFRRTLDFNQIQDLILRRRINDLYEAEKKYACDEDKSNLKQFSDTANIMLISNPALRLAWINFIEYMVCDFWNAIYEPEKNARFSISRHFPDKVIYDTDCAGSNRTTQEFIPFWLGGLQGYSDIVKALYQDMHAYREAYFRLSNSKLLFRQLEETPSKLKGLLIAERYKNAFIAYLASNPDWRGVLIKKWFPEINKILKTEIVQSVEDNKLPIYLINQWFPSIAKKLGKYSRECLTDDKEITSELEAIEIIKLLIDFWYPEIEQSKIAAVLKLIDSDLNTAKQKLLDILNHQIKDEVITANEKRISIFVTNQLNKLCQKSEGIFYKIEVFYLLKMYLLHKQTRNEAFPKKSKTLINAFKHLRSDSNGKKEYFKYPISLLTQEEGTALKKYFYFKTENCQSLKKIRSPSDPSEDIRRPVHLTPFRRSSIKPLDSNGPIINSGVMSSCSFTQSLTGSDLTRTPRTDIEQEFYTPSMKTNHSGPNLITSTIAGPISRNLTFTHGNVHKGTSRSIKQNSDKKESILPDFSPRTRQEIAPFMFQNPVVFSEEQKSLEYKSVALRSVKLT